MSLRRPPWAGAGTPIAHAVLVGSGLAVVGVASFASLALAARSLSAERFAHFATWWTTASLVGLAFAVVEMYLPRVMLAAHMHGRDDRDVVATFSRGIVGAVVALAAVVAVTSAWTLDRLFGGSWILVGLLVAYLCPMAFQSLQRAVAIGRDRFTVFPAQMGSDGLVRIAGTCIAAAAGARNPAVFATVMVAGAWVGLVVGRSAHVSWFTWRPPLASIELTPLLLLLAASLSPLVINNAGVPWLSARGAPALLVGAVVGALTLSRLPTLMVGSAYGPVLTPLARAVEQQARTDFHRAHRRAMRAALFIAVTFVMAFVAVGPQLLNLYLGDQYQLARSQLAAMAAGSALMFACVVEQAALIAMSAWHRVALAWGLALLAFVGSLTLARDPAWAVSLGVLLGPLTAVLVMGVSRVRVEPTAFARA